jgi:hypothetical protein
MTRRKHGDATPDSNEDRERGVGELRRRELEHQRGRRGAPPRRHCEKREEGEGGETTREGARGSLATTWLWRNETQERSARVKREKGFCIPRTRPVNREKQIKHTHLHATGLADDFWPISNTPYETESADVKSDEVTTDVSQSVGRRLTRSQAGSKQSPSSGSAHV